jgi:hypothetical protein
MNLCGAYIDRRYLGMGKRTAQDRDMQGIGKGEVCNVSGASAQYGGILTPEGRATDFLRENLRSV